MYESSGDILTASDCHYRVWVSSASHSSLYLALLFALQMDDVVRCKRLIQSLERCKDAFPSDLKVRFRRSTPALRNTHRCLFQFLIDLTAAHINCDAEWFLDSIFEFDLLKKQKILLPNYISRLREVLLTARGYNI